jgi:hypothetical protein
MLNQEYRVWSEQIISGMGVPVDFIYGGLQYSASNMSLRVLENHFLTVRSHRSMFIRDFLMPQIAAYLGWEQVQVHPRKFKMADDLQRSAYYLQLNQAGKLSDKSLLEDTDWDARKEGELITVEQKRVLEQQRSQAVSQAAIQGEAQVVAGKYQARAQKASMALMDAGQGGQSMPVQDPSAGQSQTPQQVALNGAQSPINASMGGQPGYDVMALAKRVVSWVVKLPDNEKQRELVTIQQRNPQLYSLVLQMIQQDRGADRSSGTLPLPEQRAPRRGPETALV